MSAEYSRTQLMAVVLARSFRDGEVVVMGAVPALPLAACRLARTLHAPNLSYVLGGSGAVNPTPETLPLSCCDPAVATAPCTLPVAEVVLLAARGGAFDVFCAGGIQIDAYGNCNLSAIGDWDGPRLRGPGSVGLPFMPMFRRTVLYTMSHNPRTFVERVDFVSGAGHPSSPAAERGYRQEGPSLVISPLATMDFDPVTRRMRLATVHPGISVEDVRKATGFELFVPSSVPTTPEPNNVELTELRRLDPSGVLWHDY